MPLTSLVIEDFYSNPKEVREFALSCDYNVTGNFPGARTMPMANEGVKEYIAKHLRNSAGEITYWPDNENGYCGSFQYTTAKNRSWIHADQTTTWAGVLYLTPDAPPSGGTGLFRHKETGLYEAPKKEDGTYDDVVMGKIYEDAQDMTKWDMVDFIGNKFNKLILYRGDLFHSSLDYFGKDINDGRLFQTFFFNTEK